MTTIAEKPQVIAQGIRRHLPGSWRTNPSPLRDHVKPWQLAAAALRYPDDHEYNIVIAGTINKEPVYVDSHNGVSFFFHTNCFVVVKEDKAVVDIKFFKCLGHSKGEGAALLSFAFQYMKSPSDVVVVLEPDYNMSEPGQHHGSPEERNRKLIAYYAKMGFTPIDQEKATAYGIITYNVKKPPMENTVGTLLKALTKGGATRRSISTKRSKRRLRYSSQTRRSRRQ